MNDAKRAVTQGISVNEHGRMGAERTAPTGAFAHSNRGLAQPMTNQRKGCPDGT